MTPPTKRPALEEGSNPVCPKCGGPVTHHSDAMGYGVTVEQCAKGVTQCDYWRTLERRIRPELARPPRGEEAPRVRRAAAPTRQSNRVGAAHMACVVAALPTDESQAITAAALAPRVGLRPVVVVKWLRLAFDAGACQRRKVHTGVRGNPPLAYWRAA